MAGNLCATILLLFLLFLLFLLVLNVWFESFIVCVCVCVCVWNFSFDLGWFYFLKSGVFDFIWFQRLLRFCFLSVGSHWEWNNTLRRRWPLNPTTSVAANVTDCNDIRDAWEAEEAEEEEAEEEEEEEDDDDDDDDDDDEGKSSSLHPPPSAWLPVSHVSMDTSGKRNLGDLRETRWNVVLKTRFELLSATVEWKGTKRRRRRRERNWWRKVAIFFNIPLCRIHIAMWEYFLFHLNGYQVGLLAVVFFSFFFFHTGLIHSVQTNCFELFFDVPTRLWMVNEWEWFVPASGADVSGFGSGGDAVDEGEEEERGKSGKSKQLDLLAGAGLRLIKTQ